MRFARDLAEALRVAPGGTVRLPDRDPGGTAFVASREEASDRLAEGVSLLVDYQARLAAQDVYAVLLVLQGLDASGKDGTIKHVMTGVNPQGVEVHSFKQPSADELAHDFLWRYSVRLPERGRIGIFNRSHYEEVTVVRVHPGLLAAERLPDRVGGDFWTRRYHRINEWERHLVDDGVRVVKVFLNLSRREQARRFLSRIDEPEKNWKFSPDDIHERGYWNDYQQAFEQMLNHTSTDWAPWYVVPADRKWFTRLGTAAVLISALADIDPRYPRVDDDVRREMATAREQLVGELDQV